MIMMPLLIALAAPAVASPDLVPCVGAQIQFGRFGSTLDAVATATLDRFVEARPLYRDGTRLAILVAGPNYAGVTANREEIARREQAIGAHLIGAGVPADRIRIVERGRYGWPHFGTQAGIVLVETPAREAGGCAALAVRSP